VFQPGLPEWLAEPVLFDHMTSGWVSLLAVVGTLLGTLGGATLSYVLERRLTERNEAKAQSTQLRQERLAACSAFAAAVMDLRGAQYDRVHSRLKDVTGTSDRSAVKAEASRLRSVMWSTLYRFRLTSPGVQLTGLAEDAAKEAVNLEDARDRADLSARSVRARERLDEFVTAAAEGLGQNPTSPGVRRTLRSAAVKKADQEAV
jgi:hypothetical protein